MQIFTFIGYAIALILLSVYSWGFVDVNAPFWHDSWLYQLVYKQNSIATMIYCLFFILLFAYYFWFLKQFRQKIYHTRELLIIIGITSIILFFGYPGFSYDVFNYIATAKVTFFWHENPYLVMPIDIANEPLLKFMHAANKVALYGPFWIINTAIPWLMGANNLILEIFSFKIFVLIYYLGLGWLIWLMSNSTWATAFFMLNPLVYSETVLNGHNDVVMMFWALLSWYLLKKKKLFLSVISLLFSVLIKYATLILIPVWIWYMIQNKKGRKITDTKLFLINALAMLIAFLASPLREEIYAWYFIWPLTFLALIPVESIWHYLAYGFSFGLPFRFAPFIYYYSWAGLTPMIKNLVTFIPAVISAGFYEIKKKI